MTKMPTMCNTCLIKIHLSTGHETWDACALVKVISGWEEIGQKQPNYIAKTNVIGAQSNSGVTLLELSA